ncbi:MAG: zinc-ribbon domain-containing protein [Desulfatiglandales bacterium]
MTVEIVCPSCRFTRMVPEEQIPAAARWAKCPKCGNRFELVLGHPCRATPNSKSEQVSPNGGQEGYPPGFWRDMCRKARGVLFSPERYFRNTDSAGGLRESFAFGLLLGSVGAMFGWFWQFLVMWGRLGSIGGYLFGQFTAGLIFFGILLLSPLSVALGMLFSTLVLHVSLLIVRGPNRGLGSTFKVIACSQATGIFSFIPFVGGIIGWFWRLVICIIGLKEIHQTTHLRVITAFLIPVGAALLTGVFIATTLYLLS